MNYVRWVVGTNPVPYVEALPRMIGETLAAVESLARELAAARAEVQVLRAARTLERADKHDAQEDATALAEALRPFAAIANNETVQRVDTNPEHLMYVRLADCREAAAVLARHAREGK